MSHERIKYIKENLLRSIEGQMCNIYEADCDELGEAIDMLKDLEEALYYCTITEAMEHQGGEKEYEFNMEREAKGDHRSYRMYEDGSPRMYADGGSSMRGGQNNGSGGGRSYYGMGGSPTMYYDWKPLGHNDHDPLMMRDHREGRSPESRRMYMEAKEMNQDKAQQLRELEKYMQELSTDVVDMIQDSTPDEKQYLEKKLMALASKISQMK